MTIEEGTGDEFLLTCFVCKNPFGLVAQFCGYCQATRQQALGVERARPDQKVIAVSAPQPTTETQAPHIPPQPRPNEPVFLPPSSPKVVTKPIPKPKPIKQKSQIQENLQLRTKNVESWQKKNSKLVSVLGLFFFLISAYFSVQSLIFASDSPADVAQKHLELGVARDSRYFEVAADKTGIRFFPSRFSAWDDSSAGNWVTTSSWNGWKGSATVDFLAGGSEFSGIPITAKYTAQYKNIMGIFRTTEWVPEPPAVLNLKYPADQQLSIYINGLAAGTVYRPAVSEGPYQMYPGEFDIQFFDLVTGEEVTSYRRTYLIDAYGTYDLTFN